MPRDHLLVDQTVAIQREITLLGGEEAVLAMLQRALAVDTSTASDANGFENGHSHLGPAVLASIRLGLSSGGVESALLQALPILSDQPIPKDSEKIIRSLRRAIKARSTPEEELLIGESSPVFSLGKSTHLALQAIQKNRGNLDNYLSSGVSILTSSEDNSVVQVDLSPQLTKPEPESPQLITVTDLGVKRSMIDGKTIAPRPARKKPSQEQKPQTINLPVALPPPAPDESIASWGIRVISASQAELIKSYGRFPGGPYEVGRLLDNPQHRHCLIQLAEAVAVLCKNPSGLKLTTGDQFTTQLNEFQILNVLCLARALQENYHLSRRLVSLESDTPISPSGEMAEIPIGTPLISVNLGQLLNSDDPHEVILDPTAGTCDWVSLSCKDPGFKNVHDRIQSEFNRQSARHRRHIWKDGRKVETKTRLYRNMESYFYELRRHYGESIFDSLTIHVADFKFPGGDGGWWESTNPDQLPEKKHTQQLGEYLFFILAQACRANQRFDVERNSPQKSSTEEPAVSIQEIYHFAAKHALLHPERVSGELEYHMPDKKIPMLLQVPSDEAEFTQWALSILAPKYDPQKMASMQILRLFDHATRGIDVKTAKRASSSNALPEQLETFCGSVIGKHYLSIEDLTSQLLSQEKKHPQVISAMSFHEDGLYTLLVAGLSPSDRPARITVHISSGRFTIIDSGNSVTGKLSSSKLKFGVNQKPEALTIQFQDQIWANLVRLGIIPHEVESSRLKDYIIGPDGKRVIQVSGKPVICWCNPVTGSWQIDETWLTEALQDLGQHPSDPFGLRPLASALKEINSQTPIPIFCPLPGHNNRNTEAAAIHPPDTDLGFPRHIRCYSCDENVWPPHTEFSGEIIPVTTGEKVIDYRPLTASRKQAAEIAHAIAETCTQYDPTARDYISGRGLHPTEDLGFVGYVPPTFANSLADIARNSGNKEVWKHLRASKLLNYGLDDLAALLQTSLNNPDLSPEEETSRREFITKLLAVDQAMRFLPASAKEYIYKLLTLRDIEDLQSRAIIGRTKDQGWVRFGGRAQMDMYWFDPGTNNALRLARSNFNGRTVEKDGQELSAGRKYFKMKLRPSHARVTNSQGEALRPTPGGFWVRDPESFLLETTTSHELAVFEGPINAATLARLNPRFKDKCLALCGTGHRTLAAIVHRLGISDLYFGLDSDLAGAKAENRILGSLSNYGIQVKVHNIWEVLPPEMHIYQPKEETKVDLNDLLTQTPEGRRYAYFPK